MTTLLLLLLALQDDVTGPWAGFKEGSQITRVQQQRSRDKPDWYQTLTLEKNGLLRTATQKPADKRFNDEGTAALPDLKPLIDGWKETARRREKLSVGARELECTVIDYAVEFRTMTLWRADGVSLPSRDKNLWRGRVALPADLVKLTAETRMNDRVETFNIQVVDLAATVAVGVQKVDCSIQESRYTLTQPEKDPLIRSNRTWLCEAIPGHIARREESCHAGAGGYDLTVQTLTFKAVR